MRFSAVGLIVTFGIGLLLPPLVVAAPQPGKVYRIGFLGAGSPPSAPTLVGEAFRQRLQELGWIVGQNVVFEGRWAERRFERLPALATELVQLKVDLILMWDGFATLAAKQATSTIPIVMMISLDAVESGLVASLAHPGGNVTGMTTMNAELNQKRLELLKEAVPESSRIAVLQCKGLTGQGWDAMQGTASALGVQLQRLEVREPDDYEGAFAAAISGRAEALVVFQCYFNLFNLQRVMALAAKYRLPAIHHEGMGACRRAHVVWAKRA